MILQQSIDLKPEVPQPFQQIINLWQGKKDKQHFTVNAPVTDAAFTKYHAIHHTHLGVTVGDKLYRLGRQTADTTMQIVVANRSFTLT